MREKTDRLTGERERERERERDRQTDRQTDLIYLHICIPFNFQ